MHTEEQARALWCPEHRVGSGRAGLSGGNVGCTCIASGCMMWRWLKPGYGDRTPRGVGVDDDGVARVKEGVASMPVGYCGLAGRP